MPKHERRHPVLNVDHEYPKSGCETNCAQLFTCFRENAGLRAFETQI